MSQKFKEKDQELHLIGKGSKWVKRRIDHTVRSMLSKRKSSDRVVTTKDLQAMKRKEKILPNGPRTRNNLRNVKKKEDKTLEITRIKSNLLIENKKKSVTTKIKKIMRMIVERDMKRIKREITPEKLAPHPKIATIVAKRTTLKSVITKIMKKKKKESKTMIMT